MKEGGRPVCRFHIRGVCRYGSGCRDRHPRFVYQRKHELLTLRSDFPAFPSIAVIPRPAANAKRALRKIKSATFALVDQGQIRAAAVVLAMGLLSKRLLPAAEIEELVILGLVAPPDLFSECVRELAA